MLPKKPSSIDALQIGFKADAVAPGAVAEIAVKPAMGLFRGQKLVVTRGVEVFELTSIEVDGVETLPLPRLNWADRLVLWWYKAKSSPSIPCIFFGAETLGNGLSMPTASEMVQLRVRNTSSVPADFFGALYGQGLR